MSNLYSLKHCENVITNYLDKGGEVNQIEEGVLGLGFLILYGKGLKTTVIKEEYLSEWYSIHRVRKYNKTPKKYEKYII